MRDVGHWDDELKKPRRRAKGVRIVKPDWDGVLLLVLFVLVMAGAKVGVVEPAKASVWGDMLLGALLLWVRSGHGRRVEPEKDPGTSPGEKER